MVVVVLDGCGGSMTCMGPICMGKAMPAPTNTSMVRRTEAGVTRLEQEVDTSSRSNAERGTTVSRRDEGR